VLLTLTLAAASGLFWLLVAPAHALPAALAVLVVTCPCALSLATPAAVTAATSRLARFGMLVTRPDALERLARVDMVVVDKTGTVTSGTPVVELKGIAQGYSRPLALQTAAALESASDHPIALAFRKHASQARVASALKEFAGRGVEGCIDGVPWRLGTHHFVKELTQAPGAELPGLSNDPGTGIALGNSDGVVATFALADGLRPGALHAVEQLRGMGLKTVIASGDQQEVVDEVARKLGVQQAVGRLTPEAKLSLVQQRESAGTRVLMVGDGINDGPVLAAASVSCAMAQGSAVAQAAADLLLLNDSLGVLAEAISTARQMRAVIRQNLAWALVYNLGAVPLAAMGWIAPWVAAIGMSTSSLLVVLNAARLARSPGAPR
jgi:P-type Cu2+ transporter